MKIISSSRVIYIFDICMASLNNLNITRILIQIQDIPIRFFLCLFWKLRHRASYTDPTQSPLCQNLLLMFLHVGIKDTGLYRTPMHTPWGRVGRQGQPRSGSGRGGLAHGVEEAKAADTVASRIERCSEESLSREEIIGRLHVL